jgi:hypothetical protein
VFFTLKSNGISNEKFPEAEMRGSKANERKETETMIFPE